MTPSIISVDWLKNHLDDEELIILDASQKSVQSDDVASTQNVRIPGGRKFDLKNDFSQPKGMFPNTFPEIRTFENGCRKLGVNQSSKIVIYDNLGIYSSPRAWWMFRTFGHQSVSVLDGGLPAWINAGFETEITKNTTFDMGDFVASLNASAVKNIDDIKANISTQNEWLIDARSPGRFNGTDPEPREGLLSGHIPNSINIPFKQVLNKGKLKTKNELLEIFNTIPNKDKPLIFSCGSGVTACIVYLAAEQVLDNSKSVYDGSWTEWATLNTKDLIV